MTIEAEVLGISASRDAVLVENDADAIAAYMSDDWVYVGPTGPIPKADIIDWIASGRLGDHAMTTIDKGRVVVHGGSVIVTARKLSAGTSDGVEYTADE